MTDTKTIAIVNPKGGVAKTETAHRMGKILSEKGKRVLLVDLDPQGSLSKVCGADRKNVCGIADAILGQAEVPDDYIQQVMDGMIDIAASNAADLDVVINSLTGQPQAPYLVREVLEGVKGYDFIILDTPGAFNLMTINALAAADIAIIPTTAEEKSRIELPKAVDCVVSVKKYNNPDLVLGGFLICDYDTSGAEETMREATLIEGYAEALGYSVYQTYIRHSKAKDERKNNGLADYKAFVDEFLK